MKETKHVRVRKSVVEEITCKIVPRFRCFGIGSSPVIFGNPISEDEKSNPPTFAAGVDVACVVAHVVAEYRDIQRRSGR